MNDYVYPARVDWRQVLRDLAGAGVSPYRVSQLMGVAWSTVQHWQADGEPGHANGQALLTIHTRYCGETLTILRQTEARPRL